MLCIFCKNSPITFRMTHVIIHRVKTRNGRRSFYHRSVMESRCSWRLISEPIHWPVQNLFITSTSDSSSRGVRFKGLVGCVRYKNQIKSNQLVVPQSSTRTTLQLLTRVLYSKQLNKTNPNTWWLLQWLRVRVILNSIASMQSNRATSIPMELRLLGPVFAIMGALVLLLLWVEWN